MKTLSRLGKLLGYQPPRAGEIIGIGISKYIRLPAWHPAFPASAVHDASAQLRKLGLIPDATASYSNAVFLGMFDHAIKRMDFAQRVRYRTTYYVFKPIVATWGVFYWPSDVEYKQHDWIDIAAYLAVWWEKEAPKNERGEIETYGYELKHLLQDIRAYWFSDAA